jgi:hypothetical protein
MKSKISNSGISIAELLVALSLMGVIVIAASRFSLQMTASNKVIDEHLEAMNLTASIAKWLSMPGANGGCATGLVGKTLKKVALPTPPPSLTLTNYNGYGRNAAGEIKAPAGTPYLISPKLRITSVTMQEKANISQNIKTYVTVPPASTGTLYWYRVAQIDIAMESKNPSDKGPQWMPLRPETFNVPVYVDALNNGTIRACGTSTDLSEACHVIGGNWDKATNTCKPGITCITEGTFSTVSCNPASYGCNYSVAIPGSPLAPAAPPMAGQPPPPASYGNPITGGYASCPPTSTAAFMGTTQTTDTLSCGKKCSFNVITSTSNYLCLRCQ